MGLPALESIRRAEPVAGILPTAINGSSTGDTSKNAAATDTIGSGRPSVAVRGNPQPVLTAPSSDAAKAAKAGVKTHVLSLDSSPAKDAVRRSISALGQRGFARVEYTPKSVVRDELGMVHVRLQQMQGGVPLFGEEIISHMSAGGGKGFARQSSVTFTGEPRSIDAPVGLVGPAVVTAAISAKDAIQVAQAAVGGLTLEAAETSRMAFENNEGRLVYGQYVILFGAQDDTQPMRWHLLVDDEGQVVRKWQEDLGLHLPDPDVVLPEVASFAATGASRSDEADDTTLYSGKVALGTSFEGGLLKTDRHILVDESRGQGIETRDARSWRFKSLGARMSKEVSDNDDVWGAPGDSPRQRASIDAHYGGQMTYDTYRDVLGINSIDLKGQRLVAKVHFGPSVVNAFWTGKEMRYGDGDGVRASELTTLDIAGHEITHGLTQRTANLVYRGESGGLNEGMSDIGGFLVEWYAAQQNSAIEWDWAMGEDCWTPGNGRKDALRYMHDPASDGRSIAHYSKYRSGMDVHFSSGIINNAFYQLAATDEGKKPNSVSKKMVTDGIGVEKSAKIFFRALIHYMGPNTTFAQARAACIKAAADLHGADSVEVAKVKEAWTVVGVE